MIGAGTAVRKNLDDSFSLPAFRQVYGMVHFLRVARSFFVCGCFLSFLLSEESQQLNSVGPVLLCDFNGHDGDGLQQTLVKHKLCDLVDDAGIAGSAGLRVRYVGYERGSKRVVMHSSPESKPDPCYFKFLRALCPRFSVGIGW